MAFGFLYWYVDRMGERERGRLGFDAIYFDAQPLIQGLWPDLSVQLENVLKLANLWGIGLFIPEPVQQQVEEHRIREFIKHMASLHKSLGSANKLLSRFGLKATLASCNDGEYRNAYQKHHGQVMGAFGIKDTSFSSHKLSDLFAIATQYRTPFVFEQEGKGFQDAVIFAAVLEHLAKLKLSGVLVTADKMFQKIDADTFGEGFAKLPLRIMSLDEIGNVLFEKYWNDEIKVPWETERQNAKTAVTADLPRLKDFVNSELTPDMVIPGLGEKVLQVLSVDEVEVQYAHTPKPDPGDPDRHCRFAVAVLARGRSIIQRDLSFTKLILKDYSGPLSQEIENPLLWIGGVEATADIVKRQFTNLSYEQLLPAENLGSGKFLGID